MKRRAWDIKVGDLVDVMHHKAVVVKHIYAGHAVVDIDGRFAQFKLENLRKCDEGHKNDSDS